MLSSSTSTDQMDSVPRSLDSSSNFDCDDVVESITEGIASVMSDDEEIESEVESGTVSATHSVSDSEITYLNEVESNLDLIVHSPVSAHQRYRQPLHSISAESKDDTVVYQHHVYQQQQQQSFTRPLFAYDISRVSF